MAHSPTFDEIAFAKVHMDMAEFSKFCVEFEIKIPKEKIVELFKKFITIDKFEEELKDKKIILIEENLKTSVYGKAVDQPALLKL